MSATCRPCWASSRRRFAQSFSGVRISDHADWREACRAFAAGFTKAVIVIGAYAPHLRPHETLTPRFLDMTEAILARLAVAGFSDEAAVRAIVLLTSVCYGHARDVAVTRSNRSAKRIDLLVQSLAQHGDGSYPNLSRIADGGIDTYGDAQLDFGICACIDGLAAQLARDETP